MIKLLAILAIFLTLTNEALAESSYVCVGIYQYGTGAAACAADKGSACNFETRNQDNHHCPIDAPGTWSSSGFYRSTGSFPNATYYYYEEYPGGCPVDSTHGVNNDNQCVTCTSPDVWNDTTKTCGVAEEDKDCGDAGALAAVYAAKGYQPGQVKTSVEQLDGSAWTAGTYTVCTYINVTECIDTGVYVSGSSGETVKCSVSEYNGQNLSSDFRLVKTNIFNGVSDIFPEGACVANEEIQGNPDCQVKDLTQYAATQTTITQVPDGQGGYLEEVQTMQEYIERLFDPITGTTTECRHLVVSTGAVVDSHVQQCTIKPGNQTDEPFCEGALFDEATMAILDDGCDGVPEGTAGTGTTPGGEIPNFPDVCTNPKGCEDFKEILEQTAITEASLTATYDQMISDFDGEINADIDALTTLAGDPSGLMSVESPGLNAGSWIGATGTSCQDFPIQVSGMSIAISCEGIELVNASLTLLFWGLLLFHLRDVLFRPSVTL